MTTTLTRGATTVTPVMVSNGYSSEQQTGNVVHDVLGRADPDITFGIAGLRTGTLQFLFLTLAQALACRDLHGNIGKIVLVDTDLPLINMTYVASGAIRVSLDDETRNHWLVEVEYAEVY